MLNHFTNCPVCNTPCVEFSTPALFGRFQCMSDNEVHYVYGSYGLNKIAFEQVNRFGYSVIFEENSLRIYLYYNNHFKLMVGGSYLCKYNLLDSKEKIETFIKNCQILC